VLPWRRAAISARGPCGSRSRLRRRTPSSTSYALRSPEIGHPRYQPPASPSGVPVTPATASRPRTGLSGAIAFSANEPLDLRRRCPPKAPRPEVPFWNATRPLAVAHLLALCSGQDSASPVRIDEGAAAPSSRIPPDVGQTRTAVMRSPR